MSEEPTIQERLETTALDDVGAKELTGMMRERLDDRYHPGKGWYLFEEVGNPGGNRYVDAVAVNAWASRGFEVHGFEIKADRSDWRSELENPAKARWWTQRCHRWYIVAPTHVVDEDEVPDTWGWLRFESHGKLRRVVESPSRDAQVGRELLGSLVKHLDAKFDETPQEQAIREAREEAYQEGLEDGRRKEKHRNTRMLEQRVERMEETLDEFEARTGVALRRFLEKDDIHEVVGALVRTRRGGRKAARDLVRVREHMAEGVDSLTEIIDDLPVDIDEEEVGDTVSSWGDWWG